MEYPKLEDDDILIVETKEDRQVDYVISSDSGLQIRAKNSSRLTNLKCVYYLKKAFVEVFLPQGYPSSVSSDYWDYQIWDTAQAFCSTVSGTLTTHAIFKGVGVGDSDATALAATITWIMKDGTGMIGRMGFAWWKGFLLDTDCKKWRLVADVVNDLAMCLELLLGSAVFKYYSPVILCLSTTMKAVVGVAGGATRAAITQHQAIRNNMGDVSAKDGSQETCVNLIASGIGILLLTKIENHIWNVWILFFLVTGFHIFANYKAVKCLKMRTLNTSRLILLMKYFLRFGGIATPDKINREESVVLGFGTTDYDICFRKVYLGCSFKKIVKKQKDTFDTVWLQNKMKMYRTLPYFIVHDHEAIYAIFRENITDQDTIMAWFHAVILGIVLHESVNFKQGSKTYYNNEFRSFLDECLETSTPEIRVNQFVYHRWKQFVSGLLANDWVVNQHQLIVDDWRVKWNSKYN